MVENTRTSITDIPTYRAICRNAARSRRAFKRFLADPEFRFVLGNLSRERGEEYLQVFVSEFPDHRTFLPALAEQSRIGRAPTFDYGEFGVLAPTVLRYAKVLSDLRLNFGTLNELNILEIGVGYGGQCRLILDYFEPTSYTLVDLEEPLMLARRFLSAGPTSCELAFDIGFPSDRPYDLVISNYAFSELTKSLQDRYLSTVFDSADMGYLTCNDITGHFDDLQEGGYSEKEMLERIPDAIRKDEVPLTNPANYLLLWDRRAA